METIARPHPNSVNVEQTVHRCRFCDTALSQTVADLGMHPPCQSIVRYEDAEKGETHFPLHARVCSECALVQIPNVVPPDEIFSEYAYFSSYSDSWVAHCRQYAEMARDRFGLDNSSTVVELASNDGYLLQWFAKMGVNCLGVEPAANVAKAAEERGVPTRVAFFGKEEAQAMVAEGIGADLLLGNNVLAHTPYLNSFVAGMKVLLAPGGSITMEFPHLLRLIDGLQFDTIYHEHFSYFSFTTATRVFAAHGITLFDVEELPTHGGSLRIFGRHAEEPDRPVTAAARELLEREEAWGVDDMSTYLEFAERVRETKLGLLEFLVGANRAGLKVAAYGAAGKGNTLLNACGIGADLISFVVDRNPYKQNTLLPGSRIPVHPPERIYEERPDVVLILPWNLRDEISQQMAGIREWGGRFAVAIPKVEVW
ncbi:class I SAM-dependent methyltransferase [soil metagenome]